MVVVVGAGGDRGASVSEIAPTCEHERRRKRRNPFVLPLLMSAGRTREPRAARTRPGPLRERKQKRGTEQRQRKHEMRDGRVRGNVQSGWSRPEHWSDTFARTKNQQAKNGTRSNFKPAQLATSRVSFTPLTVREVGGGGGCCCPPFFTHQHVSSQMFIAVLAAITCLMNRRSAMLNSAAMMQILAEYYEIKSTSLHKSIWG